jgi:hypothetical protein
MFYTLISQTPFINNDISSKKILKLFLIGSILYILLHYYLFSAPRGFLDKYKRYIYYVMAIDFVTAFILTSIFGNSAEKEYAKQIAMRNKLQQQEEFKQIESKYQQSMKQQNINNQETELFNKKESEQAVNNEKSDEKSKESSKNKKTDTESSKTSSSKKEKKKEESVKDDEEIDIPTYKDS